MLINGLWQGDEDQSMDDGRYKREPSPLPSSLDAAVIKRLRECPENFVLVASASCPWSHGVVVTAVLCGFADSLAVQWAGGPRVEGYGLRPLGPISEGSDIRHVHQLYSATDRHYTGRATVPVLWDSDAAIVLSNASDDIMRALNQASARGDFYPSHLHSEIDQLTRTIFDGLSNAVYRAGKAQRQDEYDDAVNTVFATMDMLEQRLTNQRFLLGSDMTTSDIRLFATLVRFDTVYATHFRCTRKRLVDYPALWRFTRRIYQMPKIENTVDFEEIRFGYYVNDGNHNPFGIIGQQPEIDFNDTTGL